MEPPKVDGPATPGRHRAVTPPAATAPAERPHLLTRVGDGIAGFSTHPPLFLRWAMLGAAVVILIAVPLMSLSDSTEPTHDTATLTSADESEPEPTGRVGSTRPTATTLPGLPPTSAAEAPPTTEAVVDSPAGDVGTAAAGSDDGSSERPSASQAAGGGAAPVGNGSGAATSHAPTTGGQAGGSSAAAKQSPTPAPSTQQPAPTSGTPAQPTKSCMLDLFGMDVCL